VADSDLSPMMRQYRDLKGRYPDHLLLFRLGDFYETFFEDAELAARLLQITLTARQGAPMAGIPHHAADGYIARLVHAGQKIAMCEQLEAPNRTKKLLRRDVVRIVTPGTLTVRFRTRGLPPAIVHGVAVAAKDVKRLSCALSSRVSLAEEAGCLPAQ